LLSECTTKWAPSVDGRVATGIAIVNRQFGSAGFAIPAMATIRQLQDGVGGRLDMDETCLGSHGGWISGVDGRNHDAEFGQLRDPLREMTVFADQYDFAISLLLLSARVAR